MDNSKAKAVFVLTNRNGEEPVPVKVIEETLSHYRIRLLQNAVLRNGRQGKIGDVIDVRKYEINLIMMGDPNENR